LATFAEHASQNKLPDYSFIEPIYFDVPFLFSPATDQHPSHSVAEGEKLIKYVYESLRNSPSWEDTLLLITYDEHGGFYDHKPTPMDGIPNPDGLNYTDGNVRFDFDRLGIRVPAIAISPYINPSVIHEPNGPTPTSHYEHSSVYATLKKLWNLPSFLTKRDEWAGTFEGLFTRDTPRTDCPTTLAKPVETLRTWKPATGNEPITHFQRELLAIAHGINGEQPPNEDIVFTETEASLLIREKVRQALGRDIGAFKYQTPQN